MGFVLFRLRFPLTLMVVLTFLSTIGFMALERYDFVSAAFFTVITLSTVGYGEARALDTAGQIFTSVRRFCADHPMSDDCTVLGLDYLGNSDMSF